ncbi:MAG: hypothetical protein AABN33_07120 [Acidobacteriota bacterium]
MLADKYHLKAVPEEFLPAGRLDGTALPCISRDAVLDVIEKGLGEFAERREHSIQNEKGITNRLCKILNCHKLLYFHHEGMQDESTGTSPSVDVEAVTTTATAFEARSYAPEETLMAIEAKRLPSPPPSSREREYLIGSNQKSGGVERFKLGIHGKNAAAWTMLGYVQKQDFPTWYQKVNSWIEEMASNRDLSGLWESTEKLTFLVQGATTARYRSRNKRRCDGEVDIIEIVHLWVLLC